MKITRAFGVATFLAYSLSFILLFGLNNELLQLVPDISITGFNIEILKEQTRIMILNYLLPGLLMALFGVSISKEFKAGSAGKIGSYMFILSGIGWMSFSFSPFIMDPSDIMWLVFCLKILFAWGAGVVALILTSLELHKIGFKENVKWIGIAIATLMVVELTYSWFGNYSGIISAVCWTFYFMWFAFFATQKRHQPTKFILNPR